MLLSSDSAALFVGAGLSIPSGYASWRDLLREIAIDVGLDIDRETDLISLAQYHVNSRGGSRAGVNEALIDEFTKDAVLTKDHFEIASLPIQTVWTTNYDDLLEQAFRNANKKPDVKTTVANLAQTKRDRDLIIYKMHGDKAQPQDAVLIREDYENYNDTRGAFSIALQGDLVEKTFLFLGFSFTDPNIDYILSRVGILLGKSARDHFLVMKRPTIRAGASAEDIADHEYSMRRLSLRVADLARHRISTVLIDSYAEITEILQQLNRRSHYKSVFVSGSSHDPFPFDQTRLDLFCRSLGQALIDNSLNLVSGFGLGVGNFVAYGALEQIYGKGLDPYKARLMPFPQLKGNSAEKAELFTKHREVMVSQAGFCIFISGNRLAGKDEEVENAPGVIEEFAIAAKTGKIPIPFGASGWSSSKIWHEVSKDLSRYFRDADVSAPFAVLNELGKTDAEYIGAMMEIIRLCAN